MLSIKNLRVEFGPRVVFADLSFSINDGERIAFAGHNGAGKSTLMKCIAGVLPPNGGEITKPKHHRIGYLPQEGIHVKGKTVYEETESAFGEAQELQRELNELEGELDKHDPRSDPYSKILERMGELDLALEHFDPSRIRPKIQSVLAGLGFQPEDLDRDCGEFSGGWQMRIAMAKLFLAEPEILLLDEPTNHLDITAQNFMEGYLHNYRGAIALISHDRSLMDALVTRTIAFHHGRAEEFKGNYSDYEVQLAERQEIRLKQKKAQDREIEQMERFINRFRASANKASLVQSRIKQLEKIERIEIDAEESQVSFRFPDPPPTTQSVAKLERAGKTYGDQIIFKDFDFEIERKEKIAIVGPNGAGKSTFCRLITGEEEPSNGQHELGAKTLPSFFNQNHADELDPNLTILETVEKVAARGNALSARDILGCFLFRGDDVFKKIGVLSGGERSRVALVRMLVRPANFLILDEPTNHLDMRSQDILQQALIDYEGTLLIVSHNRAFLDPIISKTIEFRPNHDPRLFHGNLSYYLDKVAAEEQQASAQPAPAKKTALPPKPAAKKEEPKPAKTQPGVNRKEQRKAEAAARQALKPLKNDLEKLEGEIAEIEGAQATLSAELSKPEVAADGDKFQEISHALANLTDKLDKAYSRWDGLTAEIESLEAKLASE
ncbi:ATP-binding cassette domain-containing protein [Roseibacillus ishigakijimensis]|uniref:ATP-binding cassette domain-containing protein n=1 Tax=Roseibacillus ishigakijimensis TaxID=454146 RepID=A0A934VLR3_9BACT|nr:ATP-binding cassette domain-containing protein [Roseibacillus ishigakijimensis]MBK1833356.1 ATP-binding cassette domain-containing protein [Roseibacillus ishigakijimensis]